MRPLTDKGKQQGAVARKWFQVIPLARKLFQLLPLDFTATLLPTFPAGFRHRHISARGMCVVVAKL